MLKRLWLIWARTVDHRIGKTDDDKPDIPILTNKDAGYSLLIRTIIVMDVLLNGIAAYAFRLHWCSSTRPLPPIISAGGSAVHYASALV